MTDLLKPNTAAYTRRQQIWRHNSFHGYARMMQVNCLAIMNAPTTSAYTKAKAQAIYDMATELSRSLKDRRDD